MTKIFFLGLLLSVNAQAASLVASSDLMFMIGCDGKIYERPNQGPFQKMAGDLPAGVKAKDILFREVRSPNALIPSEKVLYVAGDDGKLYVKDLNEKKFQLSATQQPADALKLCKSDSLLPQAPPPAQK